MGMDVYGNAPTSPTGKYFRNNIWYWRPLADVCCTLAPEICAPCEHWHSNDGDGLDADGAAALAAVLQAKLDDGTIGRLLVERDAYLAALPDEPCHVCKGAGVRSDELAVQHGWDKRPCNGCEGKGTQRPWETYYSQDEDNVREFAAFLKDCGGFKIC